MSTSGAAVKAPQILAVFGVVVLLGTFAASESSVVALNAVTLALLTGVGSACFATYLWRVRPPEERRFASLGAIFCIYYAISFGFAVLGPATSISARVLPNGLDGVNLAPLPLGILAWLAGYRVLHSTALSGGVRRLLLPARATQPVSPSKLVAIYITTVLARVLLVASGKGYGYLRDTGDVTTSASPVIQYLAVYGGLGIVILGLAIVASGHSAANRRGYRRAYRLMILPELLFGLITGQKSAFLIVIVMIALALQAAKKVSVRKLVVVALISLLVIFPLVSTYRNILRPDTGPQLSADQAPAALLTALGQTGSVFAAGPISYAGYTFDQTVGRFREIDRAAVAIQTHDGGRPYSSPFNIPLRVVTGIVPRLLWPGKPIDLYALEVSRDYYGESHDIINASSLSPVGDAYRYGGPWMVVLVLALLGAYVRLLDDALNAKYSVWLVPLLIAAIPLLRSGDFAGLLVSAIRYYLIIAVVYRFLFVRTKKASAVGSATASQSDGVTG